MARTIFIGLVGMFATACVMAAQPRVDESLVATARKALPHDISTNEIVRALGTGLWNSNRTAIAIGIPKPKASLVFVFLRQTSGRYVAVDCSGVEGGNFGKLGIAGRAAYDRFETTPVEWLHRDDGMFQVVMRTRAWKSGKRYTVSEPLVIAADGTPLYR
jgi:hypothetical protein